VDQIALHLGLDSATTLAPRDRFAFAQLLAQQFDRYARYRPDLPARWDADQPAWKFDSADLPAAAHADEAWQRQLWRRLTERPETPPHPARLLSQLAAAAPAAPETITPLFVVGTDRLDPLLVRTLAVLAHQGQTIELHLLLPSLGYLGDVSRRNRLKARLAEGSHAASIESDTHPLLASLGQQAVGTFLLLESLTQDYAEWPASDLADPDFSPEVSLLHRLQTNIRLQRPTAFPASGPESPDVRPRIQISDTSLRIHCCHSPRRELEVLRDELLRAFAELPGLLPEDVLVAVTDFDAYAPLAEAILRSGLHPLPVRLTAIPAREANPIAVALLALGESKRDATIPAAEHAALTATCLALYNLDAAITRD
jgi:exodeoxyribonuclease V gamma subunit